VVSRHPPLCPHPCPYITEMVVWVTVYGGCCLRGQGGAPPVRAASSTNTGAIPPASLSLGPLAGALRGRFRVCGAPCAD